MSTRIVNEPDRGQYTLYLDDIEKGHLSYVLVGDAIDLPSTVVDPDLRGSGLGARLVQFGLDDIRDNTSLRVIPTCPFVAKWILRNPDYQPLTKR